MGKEIVSRGQREGNSELAQTVCRILRHKIPEEHSQAPLDLDLEGRRDKFTSRLAIRAHHKEKLKLV